MLARLSDEGGDEIVSDHAAVAVLVLRHVVTPGRDDEGRVRHDAVEHLAAHRFEETAASRLDPVDAVEQGIHPGIGECAIGDVRRDRVRRGPARAE